MKEDLNANYWNSRYAEGRTGWDLKEISRPLKVYINQLTDKNLKILIPGGGYSFEAQYLWEKGFKHVFVIDLSSLALENLQERIPDFPKAQCLHGDFFDLEDRFDLILEQTFFCALDPSLRASYAKKMHSLLSNKGKIAGVLFNVPLVVKGPPFGGSISEYQNYFEPYFTIEIMERCHNSISSRDGAELFIKLLKREM